MAADSALERTIDKILTQSQDAIMSNLKDSLEESHKVLDDSLPKLEREYEKIINDGKKEADKLEKQIIGSSDLEARNKQLLLVEESVNKVFDKALEEIRNVEKDTQYSNMILNMITEGTKILGTSDVLIYTNSQDRDIVQQTLSAFSGAELATDPIECLGGVKISSKDGTMTFDNTIDARVERMKPLIRKEIATKFGIGN